MAPKGGSVTWFKVDDSLTDHPKTVALEESKHFASAMGLWALAGSWCAKHLTNGHVPTRMVRRLGFKPAHAEALVSVRFWDAADDGYQFHNWLKWQPSKESVTAKRDATAARVKQHRAQQKASVSNGVTPRVSNAPIDPVPTRPVPTKLKPPNPPGGEGLWSGKFDPSRASEYLEPLRHGWGGALPSLRITQQRDVAKRLHDWCSGLGDAEASRRIATLGPWSRRDFQPRDKARLLLTGDLGDALKPERSSRGSGYAEPAGHGEFGEGEVEL